MAVPYLPTPLASPAVNPAEGSSGANAFPYISTSEYLYAPTAMSIGTLIPGKTNADQIQALADTIRRASAWADTLCFGADPASKGASLAASLSVESSYTTVKLGELRLMCDYKPILELVGCDVGNDPSSVSSIGSISSMVRFGRRTIYVPFTGYPYRAGDTTPANLPARSSYGRIYAVWSYVNGYPHTTLAADITQGATSCVVRATDGNGGLWGVYPASGSFSGSALTVYDGKNTETVYVTAVTAGSSTATLTTTAFANAHTVPSSPDFLPVSAIPADVHQAVISLTTMLIKTRGARALTLPQTIGGKADRQSLGQAGVLEDWDLAKMLLTPYRVRMKRAGG